MVQALRRQTEGSNGSKVGRGPPGQGYGANPGRSRPSDRAPIGHTAWKY